MVPDMANTIPWPGGCSVLMSNTSLHPVTVLLNYLSLHSAVVITQGRDRGIFSTLCGLKTKVEIHSVDLTHVSDIDRILDDHSDANQPSTLFVVFFSTASIKHVLKQVNAHDSRYQEQGVLTYHHRWLLVTQGQSYFRLIERHVHNITHLSVVVINKMAQVANVYAAMWEAAGRKLRYTACVYGAEVIGEIFPTLRYGLNGRRFRATTNMWGPFVTKITNTSGGVQYVGYCMEILAAMATAMNFTYDIVEPADGEWGAEVNGSWTGLTGDLAYKVCLGLSDSKYGDEKADVMSAPSSIQVSREWVMDSTFPFYIEEAVVLYRKPTHLPKGSFFFLYPFKWQVLASLATAVLITGILAWMINRTPGQYKTNEMKSSTAFPDMLWACYGAVFSQGVPPSLMKQAAVRMVLVFWLFTCVILSATYSSNLVALLTVQVEQPPFNSLQELVGQNKYRFGLQGGTAYVIVVQNSSGVYQTMWDKVTEWDSEGVPVLASSHQTHLDMVDQGGYAYLKDLTSSSIHAQTSCQLAIFRDKQLFNLQYAVGFQNNSAYTKEASVVILRLRESGLLDKWHRQYWPRVTNCEGPSSTPSRPAISMEQLEDLFYTFITLLGTSLVLLCIEVYLKSTGMEFTI